MATSSSRKSNNIGNYIKNQQENSIQAICYSPKRLDEKRAGDKKPLLVAEFESKQDDRSVEPTENLGLTVGYKGPYFHDGQRNIDMVLVFQCKQAQNGVKDRKSRDIRKRFINKLITNGLQIEIETVQHLDTDIYFIKLHAPLVTLQTKAEDMKLKVPFSLLSKNPEMDVAIASLPFTLRGEDLAGHNHRYFLLAPFVKRHAERFLAKGECFSTLDRIAVMERILNETRFSEKEFGVKSLINQQVFQAVYPPHESGKDVSVKHKKGRQKLAKDWASFGSVHKKQPINAVKSYLGTSIAFYFIWLGFCAWYLWPLASVSVLVLVYGGLTLASYPPVEEICSKNNITQYLMCPQCDRCDLWYLKQVCVPTKIAHVFNNDMAIILAVLISIWSLFLIKFWNRHHSKLVFQWQTYEIEKNDEASRPEFVAKVKTVRKNIATGQLEQHIPFVNQCCRYSLALVTVIFMMCIILAGLLGVVIYRGVVYTVVITRADNQARVITDITAGIITLVCINMLSWVYVPIAKKLTNFENPRTQSQWENSFTYKMFAFQFVNWYSSLFYIAFFKTEHFTGRPGGYVRYTRSGNRLEGCPIQGCSMELCIQLGVIMIGQMLLQNVSEISKPYLVKWLAIRKCNPLYKSLLPWQQEYFLTPADDTLYWEYMEIVLQLGFVMMFSAAFPLAPLIAFINAMLEIRLDAMKYIHFQRRALPKMAAARGAWQEILEQLAEWSVLINGLVIAMTTDFIPKMVYRFSYSDDGSLNGYVNNSLSFSNISRFSEVEESALKYHKNLPIYCRYHGYHEMNGDYSTQYWHVMAIRIIFVLSFHYVISTLRTILDWMVADEPWNVKVRRKKTIYFIKRLFKDKNEHRSGVKAG